MTATMKWHEWMPGLTQFRSYERRWLRGDVLAGLTVAAYLVPQVMAYATLAGLSPVVGLWAAMLLRSLSRPPLLGTATAFLAATLES